MYKYKRKEVSFKRRRPMKTIPDQSLSIQEIMQRYTRGMSINAVKREGVYIDQEELDLEKVANSDFAEKADLAERIGEDLGARIETLKADKQERENKENEAKAKAAKEAKEAPSEPKA